MDSSEVASVLKVALADTVRFGCEQIDAAKEADVRARLSRVFRGKAERIKAAIKLMEDSDADT